MPKTYMRAWADASLQVAVRRRDSINPFLSSLDNVAVESALNGIGVAAARREQFFGLLEGNWPNLLSALQSNWPLEWEVRREVALYLALQRVRGRDHLGREKFVERATAAIGERPVSVSLMRDFLQTEWGIPEADDAEAGAAADMVNVAINSGFTSLEPGFSDQVAVERLAPRFEAFAWRVEVCRKPILFTCDTPVVTWRPPGPQDSYEGVGISNAQEIWFPLGPRHLLVLESGNADEGLVEVSTNRFMAVNAAIASRCFEFILSSPSRKRRLGEAVMARHRPLTRFTPARAIQVLPDGSEVDAGEVLKFWVPSHDQV